MPSFRLRSSDQVDWEEGVGDLIKTKKEMIKSFRDKYEKATYSRETVNKGTNNYNREKEQVSYKIGGQNRSCLGGWYQWEGRKGEYSANTV
jgi:hypothetical protein